MRDPVQGEIIDRGDCKNCGLKIVKWRWPTEVENWSHVADQPGLRPECRLHCPGKRGNLEQGVNPCGVHAVGNPVAEPVQENDERLPQTRTT